jgi:hypothetical protein
MVRLLLIMMTCLAVGAAQAEVYRWVDESGRVHYSNAVPPESAKPSLVGVNARGGFVSSLPLSNECHSLRCQGERLEPSLARREAAEAQDAALRAAAAPPKPRGLDFRSYVSLYSGMSEGELLGIAGAPDLLRHNRTVDTYTYMPTPADSFTTTITLVRGRVAEIDRVRKF